MDYLITNPSQKVFIRLNQNGSPEICNKQAAQKFENSKALYKVIIYCQYLLFFLKCV